MTGTMVPIVLFITAGATVVLYPLAAAIARKMEKQADQQIPAQVTQRLERMEQAIDAMAEQVERIAEGQRFTNNLLSEKAQDRIAERSNAASGVRT